MLRRGTGNIKRVHARNFIQDEANRRLQECVAPYQKQGLNALGVDYFEVLLYSRANSTQICTCKQVPAQQTQTLSPTLDAPDDVRPDNVTIDYNRPLFSKATYGATEDSSSDGDDSALALDEDAPVPSSRHLISSSAECGICYKSGFVPGYQLYGHQRHVFATQVLRDVYGYNMDTSRAPTRLMLLDEREGFAEYVVDVPLQFDRVGFSVRNNTELLRDEVLYDTAGLQLTLAHFRAAAGSELVFRCRASEYTHVVIEFDVGQRVRANLSQQSKETDWERFNTLADINFILPMTIPELQVMDVIHVPAKGLSFRVASVPYLRTAMGQNLDWSVSTRVLQPVESLKNIHVVTWL